MNLRNIWIVLLFVTCVTLVVPLAASPATPVTGALLQNSVVSALALAPGPDIDINIGKDRGNDWYKNPVVIGAGVVILALLVALVSRGGTTVVK